MPRHLRVTGRLRTKTTPEKISATCGLWFAGAGRLKGKFNE
jgi:hypothetical protein